LSKNKGMITPEIRGHELKEDILERSRCSWFFVTNRFRGGTPTACECQKKSQRGGATQRRKDRRSGRSGQKGKDTKRVLKRETRTRILERRGLLNQLTKGWEIGLTHSRSEKRRKTEMPNEPLAFPITSHKVYKRRSENYRGQKGARKGVTRWVQRNLDMSRGNLVFRRRSTSNTRVDAGKGFFRSGWRGMVWVAKCRQDKRKATETVP